MRRSSTRIRLDPSGNICHVIPDYYEVTNQVAPDMSKSVNKQRNTKGAFEMQVALSGPRTSAALAYANRWRFGQPQLRKQGKSKGTQTYTLGLAMIAPYNPPSRNR